MADNRCDIDQTQKYLQQKMNPEERKAFEQSLKADPRFREEFEFHRDMLESMRLHFKHQLKEKLQGLNQASSTSRHRWIYPRAGLAAAVALLLISAYWFLFLRTSPSELFSQYYTPYYNVLNGSERSVEGERSDLAMQLYDQRRYEEAIPVFESVIVQHPEADALRFYLALSYLSSNQPDSAVRQLEKVMQQAEFRLQEPAQWYLGLAYLQQGNTTAAQQIFQTIVTSENSYSNRATDILEELD